MLGSVFSSSRTISAASVAMSTAGSASGASAARMAPAAMVGRSPCTLTTRSIPPCGSMRESASKMRSEPEAWSARVITARAPAASAASAIAAASVATTTSPSSASRARSTTWAIIGRPPMSASGLPGRRVEAKRAGIIRTTRSADSAGMANSVAVDLVAVDLVARIRWQRIRRGGTAPCRAPPGTAGAAYKGWPEGRNVVGSGAAGRARDRASRACHVARTQNRAIIVTSGRFPDPIGIPGKTLQKTLVRKRDFRQPDCGAPAHPAGSRISRISHPPVSG